MFTIKYNQHRVVEEYTQRLAHTKMHRSSSKASTSTPPQRTSTPLPLRVLNQLLWSDRERVYLDYGALPELFTISVDYIADVIAHLDVIVAKYLREHAPADNKFTIFLLSNRTLTMRQFGLYLKKFIIDLAVRFKSRYPEQLTECHIFHAPYFLRAIHDILKSFIGREMCKKIILHSPKDSVARLARFSIKNPPAQQHNTPPVDDDSNDARDAHAHAANVANNSRVHNTNGAAAQQLSTPDPSTIFAPIAEPEPASPSTT